MLTAIRLTLQMLLLMLHKLLLMLLLAKRFRTT